MIISAGAVSTSVVCLKVLISSLTVPLPPIVDGIGIGPKAALAQHGITVLADRPGVG